MARGNFKPSVGKVQLIPLSSLINEDITQPVGALHSASSTGYNRSMKPGFPFQAKLTGYLPFVETNNCSEGLSYPGTSSREDSTQQRPLPRVLSIIFDLDGRDLSFAIRFTMIV